MQQGILDHAGTAMAPVKPQLKMRHIHTPINVMLCGSSGSGKSTFVRKIGKLLDPNWSHASTTSATAEVSSGVKPLDDSSMDLSTRLVGKCRAVSTQLGPIMVPEAGRALAYTLQDFPGHGSTLDPAGYLEDLLTFVLKQQEKDYNQLCGSRGMHKTLACGSLSHSISACLYFMPHHGPSKMDIVAMSALSKKVALLPVISCADALSPEDTSTTRSEVSKVLAAPQEYGVPGLDAVEVHKLSSSVAPTDFHLPFLLSTWGDVEGKGPTHRRLAELLLGDEVYGLLDTAWDSYAAFCEEFEAADKGLQELVDNAWENSIRPFLSSRHEVNKLQASVQNCTVQIGDLKSKLDSSLKEGDRLKEIMTEKCAQLKQEQTLLIELVSVWQWVENNYVSRGYNLPSHFQAGDKEVSPELQKRFPNLFKHK